MAKRITSLLLVILLLAGAMPAVMATEPAETTVPPGTTAPPETTPEPEPPETTVPLATDIALLEPEETTVPPETDVALLEPEESLPQDDPEEDPNDGIMLLGTTVSITLDRTRQIQWIGHSSEKLNITYTDAKGVKHYGWITAVSNIKIGGAYAYCIQPSVEHGDAYTEDSANSGWMTELTANQRSAIALALAYGYPNTDHPAANPAGAAADSTLEYPLRTDLWQISERYAATQIVIWEIVMGYRSAVAPYTCTNKSLFESFYRTSNPYGYRADWNTLRDTYNRISDSMAAHKTIPSFSNSNQNMAPIYELEYDADSGNYTITLEDTNGVLDGYEFQCSVEGVTCTRSGNTLTIAATPEAAQQLDGNVVVSAAGSSIAIDPDTVVAVWAATDGVGQTAVALKTSPDPVTAYLKLKAKAAGDLEIIKTSSSGNVSGFVFRVQGNGVDQRVTSDASGKISVTGLTPGIYTVTEILAADSAYYCTSTNPQTVKVESGKTAKVTFNNELKKWKITVLKKDAATGTAQADATLDGAVYGLYKDGKLLKEYTVKNGTFTTDEYPCGTGYTLKEISAPPGYQLDSQSYNLDAYSTAANCTGALTVSQVTVTEQVITGWFEIVKRTLNPVSGATAAEPNAQFRYYLKSTGSYNACPDAYKGTLATDKTGKAKSRELPYGTYVVEQVSGAAGTDLVEPFEVVVSEHGKTYSITKDNPYWIGSVSILKVEKGGTTPLIATFQLLDSSKKVLETGTTGSDGKLSFQTRLAYGQTYYIQETQAPEGYVLDDQLREIQVEKKDQAITLTLENVPEEGSISVKKVDVRGNALAGVSFLLEYSTDGRNWKAVTARTSGGAVTLGGCTSAGLNNGILATDRNGSICFTGLRVSTKASPIYYRLTEVSGKNGSTLLTKPAFEGQLVPGEAKDITITAVNSGTFELPLTGSNETVVLDALAMVALSMSALMVTLAVRRKKR